MGAAESRDYLRDHLRDYLRDYLPTSNLLTKRVPLLAVSAWNCRCLHSILLTSLHAYLVATTPATTFVTTFVTTPVTTPVTTFVTTPATVPRITSTTPLPSGCIYLNTDAPHRCVILTT